MSLKTWLYLYLLGCPPTCLLQDFGEQFLIKTCTANPDLSRTRISVQFHFYFIVFFRDCMNMQKFVNCVQTDICILDYFKWEIIHIFFNLYFERKMLSYIFSYIKLYGLKKQQVDSKTSLLLCTYLSTCNQKKYWMVYYCALSWCGVILHRSMQHRDAFCILLK